jgi:hypothetical protein
MRGAEASLLADMKPASQRKGIGIGGKIELPEPKEPRTISPARIKRHEARGKAKGGEGSKHPGTKPDPVAPEA